MRSRPLTILLLSFVLVGCQKPDQRQEILIDSDSIIETLIGGTPFPPGFIPTPPAQPLGTLPPSAEHRIDIRPGQNGAEFYDRGTNERFVPRGVNYIYMVETAEGYEDRFFGVGVYDHERVDADFAALSDAGYNVVRLFLDTCSSGDGCIGNPDGAGLNADYLANIADAMRLAKDHDLLLLLTSNDLPDQGGYWEISNIGESETFAGYRNAHYLTTPGVRSAQQYWDDLLTGLRRQGAPFDAVFAWSLLNEQWYFENQPPFSLSEGTVITSNGKTYDLSDPNQKAIMAAENLVNYIDQTSDTIRELDPTALITMGFFHPDVPNASRIGDFRYVDTPSMLQSASLDFFDFHAYPAVELTAEQYAQNFGMTGYTDKPIIMGEFGAFQSSYESPESAARDLTRWIAESCGYGWDGWLYWTYIAAPEAVGDATWGLVDEDGLLFDALSPAALPDPCAIEEVETNNLAVGKTVTASRSLADEAPEFAVDESPSTQWGSGGDAPQWIEIDFGEEVTIGEIRLLVGQWPEGDTLHEVFGRGAEDEEEVLLTEFDSFTKEGDWLTFAPDQPWQGIQYLRILTSRSPSWISWKEIQVFPPE